MSYSTVKTHYTTFGNSKTLSISNANNIDKSNVGFRVDTDPDLVRQFLRRETDDIKVIFSTYQSTEVVAEGAAEPTMTDRRHTHTMRSPIECNQRIILVMMVVDQVKMVVYQEVTAEYRRRSSSS